MVTLEIKFHSPPSHPHTPPPYCFMASGKSGRGPTWGCGSAVAALLHGILATKAMTLEPPLRACQGWRRCHAAFSAWHAKWGGPQCAVCPMDRRKQRLLQPGWPISRCLRVRAFSREASSPAAGRVGQGCQLIVEVLCKKEGASQSKLPPSTTAAKPPTPARSVLSSSSLHS